MRLFELLNKYKKNRPDFKKSTEYAYFFRNRFELSKLKHYSYLMDTDLDDFDVMRANIVLESLENKRQIENTCRDIASILDISNKENLIKFKKALKEITVSLAYHEENKTKIYIPIFSKAINGIYSSNQNQLFDYPYDQLFENFSNSIVDAFDTYGPELYNSNFTKLIRISSNGKEVAYFHYDTNTIYIVNSQGRLDEKIVLFDKYIKRPNLNHMLERIKPVVDAYFANDREGFIKSLKDNSFISRKMLEIIRKNEN